MTQTHRNRLRTFLASRLILLYGVVILWSIAVAGRLVQLQVVRHDELKAKAEEQRFGFDIVSARRGEILDRRLEELAISVKGESLSANPRIISNPYEAAHQLAPILGRPALELVEVLSRDKDFVFLERRVVPQQSEAIRRLALPGIQLQKESFRYYPNGELASNLLGFVGVDHEGLSGLEYLFEDQIKGTRKHVYFSFDGQRRSYQRQTVEGATKGKILVLNIDQSIQFIAEQALKEQAEKSKAENGAAIVMNPHNGEILAMASWPTFDPNHYSQSPPGHRRNSAVQDTFEPGSIFKIVTLSAVLNEGLSHPSETVDCRVGSLRLAGKVYREAKHSYGDLTFEEVLAKSSNVGTIKLALRLGEERLHNYIQRFGFGSRSGVDFPGEETGFLRPVSEWSKLSIGALAIGQELGVTAIQMLRACSVIANGGYLVRPTMVRQILSPDGNLIESTEPQRQRILDPETSRLMRQAMSVVVSHGTGRRAQLNGYSAAGKTGTAQKFIDGQYSQNKYIASFVGFAPVENPALAALVVINEPKGEYYGGSVAAPVFKEIVERSLLSMRVPRDLPPERDTSRSEWASLPEPQIDFGVSDVEDVSTFIEDAGIVEELPEEAPRKDHVITLPDSLVTVPDFTGLSLRQVALECSRLELSLRVKGSGVVVGQRPQAGSSVTRGATCEVFFSRKGPGRRASGQVALKNSPPGGQ